jgi:hypothetical protein
VAGRLLSTILLVALVRVVALMCIPQAFPFISMGPRITSPQMNPDLSGLDPWLNLLATTWCSQCHTLWWRRWLPGNDQCSVDLCTQRDTFIALAENASILETPADEYSPFNPLPYDDDISTYVGSYYQAALGVVAVAFFLSLPQ